MFVKKIAKKSQKNKVAHPPFSLSAIGPDDVGLTRNINDNPRSWRYTRAIWESFCPLLRIMPVNSFQVIFRWQYATGARMFGSMMRSCRLNVMSMQKGNLLIHTTENDGYVFYGWIKHGYRWYLSRMCSTRQDPGDRKLMWWVMAQKPRVKKHTPSKRSLSNTV